MYRVAILNLKVNPYIPMKREKILSHLCLYDSRHPNFKMGDLGKECNYSCNNCYHGAAELAAYILKMEMKIDRIEEIIEDLTEHLQLH